MNGYICFCDRDSEQFEVYAEDRAQARVKALEYFRKKHQRRKIKDYEVSKHLAEKAGTPVVHMATF
jgi:hypothetical protein